MAVSANHNLGGRVIQLVSYLIDIGMKNYRGGFRVIVPFTPPFLKCNCRYFYQDNWTKILKFLIFQESYDGTSTGLFLQYIYEYYTVFT